MMSVYTLVAVGAYCRTLESRNELGEKEHVGFSGHFTAAIIAALWPALLGYVIADLMDKS